MKSLLFKHIDNSALIVFRIIFGLLCFLESVGAIFTGWVRRTLVEPEFTFNFIGFEFLQPLPGNGMYFYYAIMGLFGLFIMLGYKYRFSAIMFTLMWTVTYLMQKSSYNNHYYLLILLSGLMAIQPANRYLSMDAKLKPEITQYAMPRWCAWVFILQMFIVYTYGSIAKIYPDWLNASVMELMMKAKKDYFLVGGLLQQKFMHYFLAYGGILFDGLIIPLLLWKKTRKWAFFASIFFHLFNSAVFQVGIFPYLSLAFALFFFEPKTIHRIFLKRKPFYSAVAERSRSKVILPKNNKLLMYGFAVYFMIQIALPLRHHVIEGDVFWTEEGHRMSWRMMLRSKSGYARYFVEDKATGERIRIKLTDYMSRKQIRSASTKPDVIWQFAQRLKQEYKEDGNDVAVYVFSRVSLNGKPYRPLTNPEVDLANVPWDVFKHSPWVYPERETE